MWLGKAKARNMEVFETEFVGGRLRQAVPLLRKYVARNPVGESCIQFISVKRVVGSAVQLILQESWTGEVRPALGGELGAFRPATIQAAPAAAGPLSSPGDCS